jgi:hypothetical protein
MNKKKEPKSRYYDDDSTTLEIKEKYPWSK